MLKPETVELCRNLKQKALDDEEEMIVPVKESDRYIHFSVYDGKVHYYSRFGRVVVTADLFNGTLDCRCSRRKRRCIHKSICHWYLCQHKLLDSFRMDEESDEEEHCPTSNPEGAHAGQESSATSHYPPKDPIIIDRMCRYLQQMKKIPMSVNNTCKLQQKFTPRETVCHFCESRLGEATLITKKAKILTMTGMYEGVETYFKACLTCGTCYRFQEHEGGIHNFNDSFLLATDVCTFLRECLQQHLPVGSIVKVLEEIL